MIEIVAGKYDLKYFENMTISELKTYFKNFSSYEDFLKKEEMHFIPPEKFNNWLYTIHFMDFDLLKIPFYNLFKQTGIVVDKIKYDHETMKVLIDNYKYYQKDEYSRILNEFRQIVLTYNNT